MWKRRNYLVHVSSSIKWMSFTLNIGKLVQLCLTCNISGITVAFRQTQSRLLVDSWQHGKRNIKPLHSLTDPWTKVRRAVAPLSLMLPGPRRLRATRQQPWASRSHALLCLCHRSKQYSLVPANERRCCAAGNGTACLASHWPTDSDWGCFRGCT